MSSSIKPVVGMRVTETGYDGNYYDIVAVEVDRLKIRWRHGDLDTTGFHNFMADIKVGTVLYPTQVLLEALKNTYDRNYCLHKRVWGLQGNRI